MFFIFCKATVKYLLYPTCRVHSYRKVISCIIRFSYLVSSTINGNCSSLVLLYWYHIPLPFATFTAMPEDSVEDPANTHGVSEATALDVPLSSIPTGHAGKFTYHMLEVPISS